jgi:hypothetical protein
MLTMRRHVTERRAVEMALELGAELLDLANDAVVVPRPVDDRTISSESVRLSPAAFE